MPLKLSHKTPSCNTSLIPDSLSSRSADQDVKEIIRRLHYSGSSSRVPTLKRSNSTPKYSLPRTSGGLTSGKVSSHPELSRSNNLTDFLPSAKNAPPLGRTIPMHHTVAPGLEDSVYRSDYKNVDPHILREIALKNSRHMSNDKGFYAMSERRNHPGAGLVKSVLDVHGNQSSYITTHPLPPVPRELIREDMVRYSAPTFTSDVLGQQGATFMKPDESSYKTQFKNFSGLADYGRGQPMQINRQLRRNCPHPEGYTDIFTHDGKMIRVMEGNTQSAPADPFDTRKSNLDARLSVLNKSDKEPSMELGSNYETLDINKTSFKESFSRETATEAASEKYRRLFDRNIHDYMNNRQSGWRWAEDSLYH